MDWQDSFHNLSITHNYRNSETHHIFTCGEIWYISVIKKVLCNKKNEPLICAKSLIIMILILVKGAEKNGVNHNSVHRIYTLDVAILIYSTREHMPSCLRPDWGKGVEK